MIRIHTATLLMLSCAGGAFAASPVANVVFLDGTAGDDPRVIDSRLVPGYTTGAGAYNGAQVTVQRLEPNFVDGFGPMGALGVPIVLPPPANQYTVQVNQQAPDYAVSFFGDAGVYDPLRVEVDPPGGTYFNTIRVGFHSPNAGTTVSYSINGGPVVVWGGEDIYLATETFLEFRGSDGVNPPVVKSATYQFQFPDCMDIDSDGLPDRTEIELGLNPLVAEGDLNGNLVDDFDEFIRGADVILPADPNYVAPLMADTDGDRWSDYDEALRGTDINDAESHPVSPNLRTVELYHSGSIQAEDAGGTGVPATPPLKPFPAAWRVDTVTPDATVIDPGHTTDDGTYALRGAGQQFHLMRARANDGSGRVLLAVQPPEALCIDTTPFCNEAGTPGDWRDEWKAEYDVSVFRSVQDMPINPRTTAEALLLNRYYEVAANRRLIIGESGRGPGQDLVLDLRAGRNEAALHQLIAAAVTPAMIDLVADYARYYTSPTGETMTALLADHFAGRAVVAEHVPEGVRIGNIAAVAVAAGAFVNAIPAATTVLTGTISVDAVGFILTVEGTPYRMLNLTEAFVPGTTIAVRALVDADNCGFAPLPAQVVEILSRGLLPLPPITDTDGDGMDDDWEFFHFAKLNQTAAGDFDVDGVSNLDEFNNGTNPTIPDVVITLDADAWYIF